MSVVYQKSDFYNAAIEEMKQGNYPTLSARLAVGDVTLTQQLGAMAQMLAMVSYQIGLAEVEPWIKARDNMVLADAAVRGVLPWAKATVHEANIINHGSKRLSISAGRRLLDNKGRIWVVKDGASVASGETQTVRIEQYATVETIHTVSAYQSFYSIAIAPPENGNYLLDVSVCHADGEFLTQIQRFNNVAPNERVYHVIADEMMNLWIQFGLMDYAGYVPNTGESLTIITRYTSGHVRLNTATPLELEYIQSGETDLQIVSGDLVQVGAQPIGITQMREITAYPSLYDENAVFLGEFAFLLQRQLSPFVFLNVWNEVQEEAVRGANQDHINCLFVSFIKEGVEVVEIQNQIKQVIQTADNSYRVKFVPAKEQTIPIVVQLSLAPMHDEGAVKQRVRAYLLAQYGRASVWARKGNQRINWQNTVKGLRENIVQLQDGISDVAVSVNETEQRLPESFRYVADESITIRSESL